MNILEIAKNSEGERYGGVLVDDLEKMAKTHIKSALSIAYGEGLLVGINRAKEAMREHKAEQSLCGWISVKDRLPKPWREGSAVSCEVFISYLDGEIRRYGAGKISVGTNTVYCANNTQNVTHWKPITPPKD